MNCQYFIIVLILQTFILSNYRIVVVKDKFSFSQLSTENFQWWVRLLV